MNPEELAVIQKLYDYLRWIGPLINRLPRDRKFTIGDRLLNRLFDVLELLIQAKYSPRTEKRKFLAQANIHLEVVRLYQRLLKDEALWSVKRYHFASASVNDIGQNLGNWLKSI